MIISGDAHGISYDIGKENNYSEDKTTVRFGAFDTEHHKLIHVEKRFENILE